MKVVDISKFESTMSTSWTSVHDIGKSFDGAVLTVDDYLVVESRYLRAIDRLVEAVNPPELRAHQIEYWDESSGALSSHGLDGVFDGTIRPAEGEPLRRDQISNLAQRCLRDVAWLEIMWAPNFLLHFGHDLHVVIAFAFETPAILTALDDVWALDQLYVRAANPRRTTLDEWAGYNNR